MTSSKDVEEMSHFLSRFVLAHLLDPLGPTDHSLQILVSYSLDMVVTKRIAFFEKFVHLQIG